ncbi:unnamed protein product [Parnassius apollo]|uniref:(apollo) hypothetical protein n=1 Tax=Parnassius apollo TaxID=110799 RepID=A0A8S3WBE5_PARAO|nr:unnamed protein product [Parnassius apollo]
MFFIKRYPDYKSICICTRLYSFAKKSHYDILNLRKNCSDKDIKEAYIKLSKEYHPDMNKNARAQEQFVQVQEAYNVLGKPNTRAQYDSMIEIEINSASYAYRPHVPYNLRNNPQYGFYQENRSTGYKSNSYYGVKGVNKLPNTTIIMLCFGIAIVGVILQVVVIRNAYLSHRRQIREKNMMLAEELDKVRASAQGKTNEAQTRMMLEKIVTAANPTMATASLGQALEIAANLQTLQKFKGQRVRLRILHHTQRHNL